MNKNTKSDLKKDKPMKQEDITINLGELYKFDAKDLQVDITEVKYSNLAWIQIGPRDVMIDFLEMPGIKKDNKTVINGTRIYMSHVTAERLSKVLGDILKNVQNRGGIEQLSFKKNKI